MKAYLHLSSAAVLLASPVAAQRQAAPTQPSPQYVSAAQIRDTTADAPSLPAAFSARLLADRGAYTYLAIRRDRTGEVEVHAAWDDVMVIESGSATVAYGGTVRGGRQTAPGEQRGGAMDGGTTQALGPGDVMVIPAGVPHQVLVPEGGSGTYVVVKIAPGAAPSR